MYNVHYVFVLFIVLYQYIIILFMYKKYSKSCFSFLKDAVDLYSTESKITLIGAKEKTTHWEAYQYPNFKVWVNSMGLGDISKLQRFCQGTNEGMGHNCRMNNINCCHQISQKFSSWHIFFGSPPPQQHCLTCKCFRSHQYHQLFFSWMSWEQHKSRFEEKWNVWACSYQILLLTYTLTVV